MLYFRCAAGVRSRVIEVAEADGMPWSVWLRQMVMRALGQRKAGQNER
jgi:hypothetical protein